MIWLFMIAVLLIMVVVSFLSLIIARRCHHSAPITHEPSWSEASINRIYDKSVEYTAFLNRELDVFRADRKKE